MTNQSQPTSRAAAPLQRRHMPAGYAVSLADYTKRGMPEEARIPKDFGPPQSLRGFEATYRNIIDYIVRITYRIWEDREVEYIRATYADGARTYDDYGLQLGDEKIVQDTYHTTGAFSDIRLIADEIVWAGDDAVGFHTSHRTIIRGTNDGDSKYGPATGKSVDVLVIANCVSLENEIFLEHVQYNNSALLQQLGLGLDAAVAELLAAPPAGWPRDAETWRQLRRAASPVRPLSEGEPIAGFDVDRFVRGHFSDLWKRRDAEALAVNCSPSLGFLGSTNRAFSGLAPYRDFVASVTSPFADLELQMDEVYWMGNDRDGYLTSERWSAVGVHAKPGLYGEPTGRAVQIWGVTQHEIRNGRIVREWTLFNELDLMMQIEAARRGFP